MDGSLKLKEVIWEICGKCSNMCSYCGSKDVWNTEIDEEKIKKIADAIGKFPPEQIDISGGDPTLVSLDTHKYVVDALKKKFGTFCKILINPKSYKNKNFKEILECYDYMGLSINTEEELDLCSKGLINIPPMKDLTIITNFSLDNIFVFDKIKDFVKFRGYGWQIQFNVMRNKTLGIYQNKNALKHLSEKVSKAIFEENVKIIIADNANCGPCSAGSNSIGILHDGTVIPCLSMRSWEDDDYLKDILPKWFLTEGNVLEKDLKTIWIEGFKKYRFYVFECCKDHCENSVIEIKDTRIPFNTEIKVGPDFLPIISPEQLQYPYYPPIQQQVIAYAVYPYVSAQMYACSAPIGKAFGFSTSSGTSFKVES